MMRLYIISLLLCVSSTLFAAQNLDSDRWELYQAKVYFENDMFGNFTDAQYSSGEKFNLTYHVQEPKNFLYDFLVSDALKQNVFINFAIVNQIYTPINLEAIELIVDDRPYAGWTYFETGVHKSSSKTLSSLVLKVGVVGPLSYSQEIQTKIHELVNAGLPMGWDNQLHNELGVNLTYIYKKRYTAKGPTNWLESSIVPFVEADLGNVSTQASLGTFVRIGYNITKDFGLATLDHGGEASIPSYEESIVSLKKDWSLSFNFSLVGSAVARDIFLDGNTFGESHSVDKNTFVAYGGVGMSVRYKSFMLDIMNTRNTKKADKAGLLQDVGTVIATWNF